MNEMEVLFFERQLDYCQTYARDDRYIYCEDCTSCDCCPIDPDHPLDKSLEYCEDFEFDLLK